MKSKRVFFVRKSEGDFGQFKIAPYFRIFRVSCDSVFQRGVYLTSRERRGDYLGKTVQIVPHVTNHIIEWIEKVGGGEEWICYENDGDVDDDSMYNRPRDIQYVNASPQVI